MFVSTGKARKPLEREEARELRRQGVAFKRIARELEVSPSTVFNWTRDIKLSKSKPSGTSAALRGRRTPNVLLVGRRAGDDGVGQSGSVTSLTDGTALEMPTRSIWPDACSIGLKGARAANTVRLSNSDVNMVRFLHEVP